jgi:hypothetical protein
MSKDKKGELKECRAHYHLKKMWFGGIHKTLALIYCENCRLRRPRQDIRGSEDDTRHTLRCSDCGKVLGIPIGTSKVILCRCAECIEGKPTPSADGEEEEKHYIEEGLENA